MLDAGLLAEVERLHSAPEPLSRTALQALGYQELIDHLDGCTTLEEAVGAVVYPHSLDSLYASCDGSSATTPHTLGGDA